MRLALLALLALVACAAAPIPPGPVPQPQETPSAMQTVAVPSGYRPVWVKDDCLVREVSFTDLKIDGTVRKGETPGFVVICPDRSRRY